MGQYWKPVNLDKREFFHPHKVGDGLKLLEIAGSGDGVAGVLSLLLADFPEARGGGDPIPHPVIGSWACDRVALVGDYAERGDRFGWDPRGLPIYELCRDPKQWADAGGPPAEPFRDISEQIIEMMKLNQMRTDFFARRERGEGW